MCLVHLSRDSWSTAGKPEVMNAQVCQLETEQGTQDGSADAGRARGRVRLSRAASSAPGFAPGLSRCERASRHAAPSIGHRMRVTCRHFNSVALAVTPDPESIPVTRPLSPLPCLVLYSGHWYFLFVS